MNFTPPGKARKLAGANAHKKIIFLDRDGVINREPGKRDYVLDWKYFKFLPGALRAIRLLSQAGYTLYIISNQGCVNHGLITKSKLKEITARMIKEIRANGGSIQGVHYCIHRKVDACRCKKPQIGLLVEALGKRVPKKTASRYHFIGDNEIDVQAGRTFGCQTTLVLCGKTRSRAEARRFVAQPDNIKKNLLETAQWILRSKRKS